jgi:hypothetical protein
MRKGKGNTLRYNKIYKKTTGPVISYESETDNQELKRQLTFITETPKAAFTS